MTESSAIKAYCNLQIGLELILFSWLDNFITIEQTNLSLICANFAVTVTYIQNDFISTE